jgi:DNA-binding transcriptional LysR family regulator
VLIAQLDRQRSVLRAADAAGMSQPAASKMLRELEDLLGVALFERHARGVEPTPCREIVIRHAHSVLSEIRRTQDEVEALKRGERLRVAIGSVLSPSTDLVPMAVSLLEREHRHMQISVDIDTSPHPVARLLEGGLDIVIGRVLDPEHVAVLYFEPLAEEPHHLIARAGHPLAQRRRLRIADLVEHTWVMPPAESILRERVNAMFLQRGLRLPARIVETTSLPLITNLLRRSDMLVTLPEDVVRPYCEAGMLAVLPVDLQVHMDSFGLITRREHTLSRAAVEVLRALGEAARSVDRLRSRAQGVR